MCPSSSPPDPSPSPGAIAAPADLRRFGTPTRRAVLAGGLATAIWPFAAQADAAAQAINLAKVGLDGAAPLRGEIGKPLRLTVANTLDTPAAFALLGLHVENAPGFAGLGAASWAPGETRALSFTPSEAGFALWGAYGPIGPIGAIVVPEAAPPEVDFEAVVVFSGDPDAPRVNGALAPLTLSAPPGARVRLRLANASAEGMLALATAAKVQVVAIDGQPCEMFAPRDGALPLCPTARFDLLFDLGEGGADFLRAGASASALRIEAQGERVASRAPPAPLPANPRLPRAIALEQALRATLRLKTRNAPGAEWPKRPLFTAKRGQPVALTLSNDTPKPQTLRLEGHWARRLHALDDGWDPYWRDALFIEPGQTLHVAFLADTPGRWPLASPWPERRALGMATWFQVA